MLRQDQSNIQQQLRQWFQTPLGQEVIEAEQLGLDKTLSILFGYHLAQISCGYSEALFAESSIQHKFIVEACLQPTTDISWLRASPTALPLMADSIDVMLLHHCLEFHQQPHQVLREVAKVLIPEGHVVIVGFNPLSWWGGWKILRQWKNQVPWVGHYISALQLSDWLNLLDLQVISKDYIYLRPPWRGPRGLLQVIEWLGRHIWPMWGAVYIIVAKKRVSRLTPIMPRWRFRQRRLLHIPLIKPSTYTYHE